MTPREHVALGLATALLGGAWTREPMRGRVAKALQRPKAPRWAGALVDQVLDAYRDAPADRPRELAAFLQTTPAWHLAWQHRRPPQVLRWTPTPTAVVARPWPVLELGDLGALANLLSRHVLNPIPLHPAAHGCVPGRSVRTAVQPHADAAVVIRADVEGFFSSISAGRVWGLLRMAGLPEAVAHAVTGLVTTVVPVQVWRAVPRPEDARGLNAYLRMGERIAMPHLPQGAPSSPALGNLAAFSLDRRLSGLATSFGARYTRYVDDLTFSGGPSLRAARSRFVGLVDDIVASDGLRLNDAKTVVLGAAGRQQVLGAVINDHPTIPRRERDALRALLHNCAVSGWQGQARGRERDEFRAALLGRISWVGGLDSAFGGRLRTTFDGINWS